MNIKKTIGLLALLFCFCISGCATVSVNRFTEVQFRPTEDLEDIEIFHIGHHISRPYTELAEIDLVSKDVHKLKQEASKLGADGIIIIGPSCTGGLSNHISFKRNIIPAISLGFGGSLGKGRGWKAIAIKYKNIISNSVTKGEETIK